MSKPIKAILSLSVVFFVTWLVALNTFKIVNQGEIRLLPKLLLQTEFEPVALDKIYVIALDQAPQRYAQIKKQLDKLSLNHIKFQAVNGYKVGIEDASGNKFYGHDLKNSTATLHSNHSYKILCPSLTINYTPSADSPPFGAGALGCECSHREVWNDIIKNNIKYALILEDDAVFIDDFLFKLEGLLKNAPIQWDIIYLNLREVGSKKFSRFINNKTISKAEKNNLLLSSTTAYILNLNGAKQALANSQNLSSPVDTYLSILVNKGVLTAYKAYHKENIAFEKPSETGSSTIDQMGRRITQ